MCVCVLAYIYNCVKPQKYNMRQVKTSVTVLSSCLQLRKYSYVNIDMLCILPQSTPLKIIAYIS